MALNRRDVEHIAHLARLQVSESELPDVTAKLSAILEFVDQLRQVDTQGITPMAHPLDVTQRLRADEVTERDEHKRYQRNASAVEAGLYLVPRVIE